MNFQEQIARFTTVSSWHSFAFQPHTFALINACRDVLKSFFRKKVRSIEEIDVEPFYIQEQDKELLDAVLRLPPKYRNVIYLFYYEGYTAVEIAGILKKSENTVYTWLDRGRKELKKQLGGEWIGE